jgi:uncharacterized LabA/DUF88 family protein
MRTFIYIDGFNFFYRSVKGTPYKWVNFKELCRRLLKPYNKIVAIRYFTALVSELGDPKRPIRQETYIRALQTYIPELTVHYGSFQTHQVMTRLVKPINGNNYAEIYKTEEKGSDVNLAVHLLNDAWLDNYDCAVIVSNDSDLAEAIRLVKKHHKKLIGLFILPNCNPSRELQPLADFVQRIRKGVLANSQLPDPIPGTLLHKPLSW